AGADVRGRHSEVLQKGRVIRPAAQVSDARAMLGDAALPMLVEPQVGMPLFRLARLLLYPVRVHSSPSRTGNLLRHVTYKLLQRRYSLGVKIRPGYSNIHVEIGHRVRKLARMVLRPLGRTDQTLFLGVPACKHNRSLWPPTLFQQNADATHSLQHSRRAAIRI